MSTLIPSLTKGTGIDLSPVRHSIDWPSGGAGDTAVAMVKSLQDMIRFDSGDRRNIAKRKDRLNGQVKTNIEAQIFEALAEAKIMTSRVAMHLSQDWRVHLFAALDELLDVDDWDEDEQPISSSSFATFLRLVLLLGNSTNFPGLGVSNRGNLIAAWTTGADRLTMEFLPADVVRWSLSCAIDESTERAAGETHIQRLVSVLSPYDPSRWFLNEPNPSSRS